MSYNIVKQVRCKGIYATNIIQSKWQMSAESKIIPVILQEFNKQKRHNVKPEFILHKVLVRKVVQAHIFCTSADSSYMYKSNFVPKQKGNKNEVTMQNFRHLFSSNYIQVVHKWCVLQPN